MKKNKRPLYIILAINVMSYIYNVYINGTKAVSGIQKQEVINAGGMSRDTNIIHLFTSLFAHQSLSHIVINMVLLVALGNIILDNYNKTEFIITFLLSGFISNVYMLAIIKNGTALGASGCLFGLLGLMLTGALISTKKTQKLNRIKGYVLTLTVIYIILSFATMNNGTNIYSHIVGLAVGICVGFIIMIINKRRDKIERVK